ncbi:MAG TPA: metallopeptidase family protein [Myxococcota bacterium]|jgi:predicted Zn-dependent protease with MMP-like domain|nr:metallopeptidase family protein [Myxococcota bacterium]
MRDRDRYWDCLDQAMEASHGGRTEEALAWLDEALKAHPNGAEAHNGRGEILWDAGRIDEALYELELATMADPKFMTAHLNRIELLIEERGEYEHALQRCDELLAGRPELPRPDRATEAEIHYLKAKALFYLDDLEGALFLVRRAGKVAPDVPVYRAFEGQILFETARFEDGRRALEQAVLMDSESAHAVYHLALVLERLGEDEEAERAFRRANALDPDHYAVPVRVQDAVFQRASEDALANLPRSIREAVENVPILVRDLPEEELLTAENVSPTILGIFIGVPRTEAALTEQARDVNRVILFKKNLEKICRTRAELVEQIQTTLQHEIGHYLGLDDDDLERIGLA